MKDTLIIGLLLAMPAAVILASAALALLAGQLRRSLRQALKGHVQRPDMTQAAADRPLEVGPSREAATLR
jgi:predicted benzoate:H+ symporter BenE